MTCDVSLDAPLLDESGLPLFAEDGAPLVADGLGYFPSSTTLEGTDLAYDTAQVIDAQDRLLQQFKEKPRIEALVCALVSPVVEVDAATWQLVAERHIDVAQGAQLDGLGALVDEQREGRGDALYRAVIRAKIRALRSRGRPEDMIAVATLILTAVAAIELREFPPAALRIDAVGGNLATVGVAAAAAHLLRLAKPAGVRMTFAPSYAPASETFTLADPGVPVPQLDEDLGLGGPVVFPLGDAGWDAYGGGTHLTNVGPAPDGSITADYVEFTGGDPLDGARYLLPDAPDDGATCRVRVWVRHASSTREFRTQAISRDGVETTETHTALFSWTQIETAEWDLGAGATIDAVRILNRAAGGVDSILFWNPELVVTDPIGGVLAAALR